MQFMRFVRTLVPILLLGLVGGMVGCSSEADNKTPEERKAFGKMMMEDMKNAQKQKNAARGAAKAQGKGGQSKAAHQ